MNRSPKHLDDRISGARKYLIKQKAEFAAKARNRYFRGLIAGDVKSGKTQALETLPRPLLIHNFDPDGLSGMSDLWNDPESGIIVREFVGDTVWDPHVYMDWKDEMDFLLDNNIFEAIASFAMDSVTGFASTVMNYIVHGATGTRIHGVQPSQNDYQVQQLFTLSNASRLIMIPCHIVGTAHIKETELHVKIRNAQKEIVGEEVKMHRDLNFSPSIKASVMPLFSEIYTTDVRAATKGGNMVVDRDGNPLQIFRWNTTKHDNISAADSRTAGRNRKTGERDKDLPQYVPQNFRKVFERLGLSYEDKDTSFLNLKPKNNTGKKKE